MTTLCKVLMAGRRSNHDGSVWPEPPGTRRVDGEVVPCENGLHLVDADHVIDWLHLGTEIWEAEPAEGATIVHADGKVAVSEARLVRQLPWDDRAARLFAADCAAHVLHLYEDRYPGDDRPREAIEMARKVANGEADDAARSAAWAAAGSAAESAAGSAAESAAESAAWAAAGSAAESAAGSAAESAARAAWAASWSAAWSAAESAAESAARSAAWAASWSAAWSAAGSAAESAARAAEREWQVDLLLRTLGIRWLDDDEDARAASPEQGL